MKVEPQQLRAFLLDAGLVTKAQFEAAQKKAEKTKQKVGDVTDRRKIDVLLQEQGNCQERIREIADSLKSEEM